MEKLRTGRRIWLLVAGVAVVGVLVVVTVTTGGAGGLWFLLILACPLLMLFMMGSMGHAHTPRSDVQQHEGMIQGTPDVAGLSRDEQVRALRPELTRLMWQQEALRQDLERLEAEQKAEATADTENRAGLR